MIGILEGFLVGRSRTRVFHLQFADTIFSNAKTEVLQNLKIILLIFGHIYGLKINLAKSTLSGINMSLDKVVRLDSMLESIISNWPLPYLGLPLRRIPWLESFGI